MNPTNQQTAAARDRAALCHAIANSDVSRVVTTIDSLVARSTRLELGLLHLIDSLRGTPDAAALTELLASSTGLPASQIACGATPANRAAISAAALPSVVNHRLQRPAAVIMEDERSLLATPLSCPAPEISQPATPRPDRVPAHAFAHAL